MKNILFYGNCQVGSLIPFMKHYLKEYTVTNILCWVDIIEREYFITEIKKSKFPKANKEIRVAEVRLVDAEGEMIGVVTLQKAMQMAFDAGLDLVEISPNAEPPVCKILDFSRFKYDAKKRQQESKKKQKKVWQ